MRSVLLCLLTAVPALASDLRYVPVAERVALSDLVILGTVAEVEPKPVQIDGWTGGKTKGRLYLARVKIAENLLGAGKLTEVRVGFVVAEDQPDDGLKFPTPVLDKGNQVLLFLRKRRGEDFYQIWTHFGAVGKKPTNKYFHYDIAKITDETRPLCRVATNLDKAPDSDNPEVRMQAAWMLVTRYRSSPMLAAGETVKEEPIPEGESVAILRSLPRLAKENREAFGTAAYSLQLTKADGFDGAVYAEGGIEKAARWLEDNTTKYRIKKYVSGKK